MKTKIANLTAVLLLGMIITIMPGRAEETGDISGTWAGAIQLPGIEMQVTIDFSRDSLGNWSGLIDIPQQGANDLPLGNIKIAETKVTFDLLNVPGNPTFRGALSADTKEISGEFSQGGQSFPFSIARKSTAETEKEAASLEEKLARLRAYIDSTMKSWQVPGAAVAVIKDGKLLLAEGFGFRSLKDSLPVTNQTLFAIGSATKPFTTALISILVDSGRLDWDLPVQNYLSFFKMKDEFASEQMTLRDLVTHRSGLPRHDLVWYNNQNITRRELVERLQYLESSKGFRTTFQYQNLMFLTAGYIAETVTGRSWEENIEEKIFRPLGMSASNFSVLAMKQAPDHALPYRLDDSAVNEIPYRDITIMGPAGSINSNLEEMARWAKLFLDGGKAQEKQVISAAALAEMTTPQMSIAAPMINPETSAGAYGLGWFLESYRGHNRAHHGGNIDGFSSLVSFYPHDNLGIVVLTNMDGSAAPGIISNRVADLMLDITPIDWNTRIRAEMDKAREAQKKAAAVTMDRVPNTKPSRQLDEYAGEYDHPGYGRLKIVLADKKLSAVYNDITLPLEHWHYDVFRGTVPELKGQFLIFNFIANNKGDMAQISVPLEMAVGEIVFTRAASAEMRNPAFLQRLTGEYEIMGQITRIELKNDSLLTLTIAGQPQYELVPYRGTEFTIKGLTGFSVEFKAEGGKPASEMIFKQPNGVFTAARKK